MVKKKLPGMYLDNCFVAWDDLITQEVVEVVERNNGAVRLRRVKVPVDVGLYELIIPEGITELHDNCFRGQLIEEVVIPDTVKKIGNGCFRGTSLIRVKLPDSIKKIGHLAFRGCKNLKTIILPRYIKHISFGTFWGCTVLDDVSIPSKVECVDGMAFVLCESLMNVSAEDCTSFAPDAFHLTPVDNMPWKYTK